MDAINLRSYELLSPFETEDELIRLASTSGQTTAYALMHHAAKRFGFQPNSFVYELVDAITGHNHPVADRMLVRAEQVVHEYLMQAMCGSLGPPGRCDLLTTEGGTAAICHIFRSLKANRPLRPGDQIALAAPIFTPYLERPRSRTTASSRSVSMRRKRTVSSSLTPNLRSWRIQGQGILPGQPRKSNLGCAQPRGEVDHITGNRIVLAWREASDAVAKGGPIDAR